MSTYQTLLLLVAVVFAAFVVMRFLATRRHARQRGAEEAARIVAEQQAAEDAARREAERQAAEEAARKDAERQAAEEAARKEAERQAAEEAARKDAERQAAEEAARKEAGRQAAEEAARRQAERQAAGDAAQRRMLVPSAGAQLKAPEQTVVMVADDSKVVRVKTSRLLNAHKYQVLLAEDGLDAARQIEQAIPDLLVTDVDMPGLGGLELVRQLRSDPRTASLPIIMVSAGSDVLQGDALAAGVNVVLGKPYPEELLISHIKSLVTD